MKKLTVLTLTMGLLLNLHAQKNKNADPNLPDFGSVEKSDLQMKECDFDEKAEALILVDDGQLEFVFGKGMELKRRVRIKILNSKGLDWANVHLSYRSQANEESISGLEAQTYNLDERGNIQVSKVEKKLIYEKKLNKRYTEKAFTFSDVKVGSIIEYKFKHSGIGLIDWYFQRSIPVRYSHFIMDFPEEIEVSTMPFCNRKYESNKQNKSTRIINTYSMSKVPGFRDEPYIINEDYYRDRLETKVVAYNMEGRRVSRVTNWIQVIKYLMEDEDFGMQIKKNIPRTADLDEKLNNIQIPYERMKVIYKYVQDNMEWNEYPGIWALDGVKSAWKDKKGTLGEINLILVNLLKDAGLVVHPVLVSTHDNGIVNTIDAGTFENPGFLQFDKVMAYVEIDKKVYVLDATQKNVPVHLIPEDVLLTQGLVIEKLETFQWGWKTMWNEASAKNILMVNGEIDETGKLKGEAIMASSDYARLSRAAVAKKGKEKYIEKFLSGLNSGITVEDVKFENLDSDSLPLIQRIKFSQPLNTTGEFQYFSNNLFSGFEKNPFVADNRFSDIFFGCRQSFTILGNFTLPEGYEFDELPKNLKMILPDTSIVISRASQVSNNRLETRISLEFKKAMYPADQYDELHEFYHRLFDILNEQFVIRKKKKA